MKYGAQSMVGNLKSVLLKHPKHAFISQEHLDKNYERYNYLSSPNYEKVLLEYQSFEKAIKTYVENVFYLPRDDETGIDSIYTHDSVKITNKGAIYLSMGKDLRKNEPKATKAFLESIGIPTLGVIEGEGKIEGGDVLWLDQHTVAIGRGYRTNDEGIKQFKNVVSNFVDEFIVVPLPHGNGEDECLHLMSLISMVDNDLAVVYSKFLPVFFREYLINRGIQLIEVDDKEYDNLGSNILALAPRKCIILKGNPIIKSKLLEAGVEVYEYEGEELSIKGTGGATCLTCPILRE